MALQVAGTEYEKEWKRFLELQQEVLRHLVDIGPTQWEAFYDHFDQDESGEVAQTLRYLVRWKHVTVEPDGTVTITSSGRSKIKTGQ